MIFYVFFFFYKMEETQKEVNPEELLAKETSEWELSP